MSGSHSIVTGRDVHTPIAFTFADEAARLSATNPNTGVAYVTTDLYKYARQTDDNSIWFLIGLTPDWKETGAEFTAGSGLSVTSNEFSLGGTLTADAILTPDVDGSHTVNLGADTSNRIDAFNAFAENFAGLQSGSLNDRSFVSIFGDLLGGVELGYFQNESDLMGLRINLAGDNNFEVVNQVTTDGMKYAAAPSAPVDLTVAWKGYVDGSRGITADQELYLNGNDRIYYEGANNTTTNLLTIHGDGSHSVFDPFVTLHEGFATANGTDTQALIVNFGKANKVQWNDGTRSVDVFAIESIVNGSQVFQRMETFFGGIEHRYTDLDNFKWYFQTTPGTGLWRVYEDETEANLLLQLDTSGNLTLEGYASAAQAAIGKSTPTGARMIDVLGPTNGDLDVELESGNSALYDVNVALESENKWEIISEHFEVGVAFGDLVVRNDTTATEYMRFDDSETAVVIPSGVGLAVNGDTAAPLTAQYPSNITGAVTAYTVTTTETTIVLDTQPIDGSGVEYSVVLASNRVDFDLADGNRIYEICFNALFDLNNNAGDTRSYGRIKAQLDGVDVAYSEQWAYIREFQGGTNGKPNTGLSKTFQIQPAANDQLTFVVWGTTDAAGTLTDFDLVAFDFTIKRLA